MAFLSVPASSASLASLDACLYLVQVTRGGKEQKWRDITQKEEGGGGANVANCHFFGPCLLRLLADRREGPPLCVGLHYINGLSRIETVPA